MRDFFSRYKKYIIKHDRVAAYKPTSEKGFNKAKLFDAYKEIEDMSDITKEDVNCIADFVDVSGYLHGLYKHFYSAIREELNNLNLKGVDVAEYFIAGLNREFKVIVDKRRKVMGSVNKGTYCFSDMMNFKLESPVKEFGMIDARGGLECTTDAFNLLLNYLRYFLNEDLQNVDADPNRFAGSLIKMMQAASMVVDFKHTYDDILFNGGYVTKDTDNKLVNFDYDSHEQLKLLMAGDLMFSERRLHVMSQVMKRGTKPHLFKYVTNYRIKRAKVTDGCLTLEFGQGEPKEHKAIVTDMEAALEAYYEFLPGDTVLPRLSNVTVDEAVSIWCALQYIAIYVTESLNFDVSLYSREDYAPVPRKILKTNLYNCVVKLTGVKLAKVKAVIGAMEADWTTFNNIWSAMIYPVGDYFLLPFFPLIYSALYNVVDHLLLKGGFDLDERGTLFENYLYEKLTKEKVSYPITVMKTGYYGVKGNEEEIDVLIGMKNIVLVGDAKCIHYSVEPKNYAEAWERLEEGCEQTLRKIDFIKNNPEYFRELGDLSDKAFVPFVVTNYPTFVGFSHKGVYVIDSHSFLAYMQGGYITIRELGANEDPIRACKKFYYNEDGFSNNIEDYIANNPVKQIMLERIFISEKRILMGTEPWRFVSKYAELDNDPRFNISNGI